MKLAVVILFITSFLFLSLFLGTIRSKEGDFKWMLNQMMGDSWTSLTVDQLLGRWNDLHPNCIIKGSDNIKLTAKKVVREFSSNGYSLY